MKVKHVGDFKTESLNDAEFNQQINSNSVYTLDILSLSSDLNKKITATLIEKYPELSVSPGFTVQVSVDSKLSAVKAMYGEDLSNVVYVGDGYNDVASLMSCGTTFAVGNKPKVLKSANCALNTIADMGSVLFDGIDYSQISKTVIQEAELKAQEKQQKKEMSRIKYAVSKLSKSKDDKEKGE